MTASQITGGLLVKSFFGPFEDKERKAGAGFCFRLYISGAASIVYVFCRAIVIRKWRQFNGQFLFNDF